MPVTMKKLGGGKMMVMTPEGVKSRATSFQKAKSQERLLNAVEHSSWRPMGDKGKRRMMKGME
jgi:hypothetical protein